MLLVVLISLLVVIPLAELFVIIQVAHQIGGLNTIGVLVLSSIIGGWLLRVEGFGVMRRFSADVSRGKVPAAPLVDGLVILVGGLMMLLPGFITDALGLLLLLPPVRALARKAVLAKVQTKVRVVTDDPLGAAGRWMGGRRGWDARGDGYGDVIDVESWEEPPRHNHPMLPGDTSR